MKMRDQVNCDQCGRFISQDDLYSDRVAMEDVSDGIEYGPPCYVVTCPSCVTKAYNEHLLHVPPVKGSDDAV